MKCTQCHCETSAWRRGLLTGICPTCQSAPSPAIVARLDRMFLCTKVVTTLVVVVVVGYCTPMFRGPFWNSRFSSAEWITGNATLRGKMARDLIRSRSLERKSREEVRAALGIPDIDRNGGQTIRFSVDVGWRWVIKPYLYDLVVRFGKVDEVFSVTVEPRESA